MEFQNISHVTKHQVQPASTPVPQAPVLLRPLVTADAAFGKPQLPYGQIMTVTSFDSNDNLIILAFAHVSVENIDNWTWFLRQFREAFPRFSALPVVCLADQDKGMSPAMRSELSHWIRRACARHLEPHVTAMGSKEVRKLFWKVSKAWTKDYANEALETLLSNFPECHRHLTTATYIGADQRRKDGVTLDMWTNH